MLQFPSPAILTKIQNWTTITYQQNRHLASLTPELLLLLSPPAVCYAFSSSTDAAFPSTERLQQGSKRPAALSAFPVAVASSGQLLTALPISMAQCCYSQQCLKAMTTAVISSLESLASITCHL